MIKFDLNNNLRLFLLAFGLFSVILIANSLAKIRPVEPSAATTTETMQQSPVSVFLQPNFLEVETGKSFVVDLGIRSERVLEAIEVSLTFDGQVLKANSVEKGEAFSILEEQSIVEGRVFLKAVADENGSFSGVGKIATLRFEAVSAGQSFIGIAYTPRSQSDPFAEEQIEDKTANLEPAKYVVGSSFERGANQIRRAVFFLLPVIIFIALVGIVGFLIYKVTKRETVFQQRKVPMDKAP